MRSTGRRSSTPRRVSTGPPRHGHAHGADAEVARVAERPLGLRLVRPLEACRRRRRRAGPAQRGPRPRGRRRAPRRLRVSDRCVARSLHRRSRPPSLRASDELRRTPGPGTPTPASLRAERERIFRPAWHYVGHARAPAGAVERTSPASTGGLPVVVTRDRDGELRAFLNVCRHRGSEVVSGEGRRETLQCPYHAWTYGLDGDAARRRRAPTGSRASTRPAWRSCRSGSRRWGPFVFVNADAERTAARRGARRRSACRRSCDARVPRAGRVRARRRTGRSRSRTTSSATTARSPIRASAASSTSIPTRTCSRATGRSGASTGARATASGGCEFHLVWPALKINVYPGFANLSIGPVWPESPGRTVGFLDYFFGADVDDACGARADRVRRPGRPGGHGARRVRPARRRLRPRRARPFAAGKRASDRRLPAQGGRGAHLGDTAPSDRGCYLAAASAKPDG